MNAVRAALCLLVVGISLSALPARGQLGFSEVTPADNPWFQTPADEDFWINSVAPADVDADGDLDLAVIGFYVVYNVSADDKLFVFMNDGPDAAGKWIYTPVEVPLGDAFAGNSDLSWGDFDADGFPDLALASEGVTQIYHNEQGTLILLPNELPAYWEDSLYTIGYDLRSLSWADFDNDGDLDLLLPSVFDDELFEYRTDIIRNDGSDGASGWHFAVIPNALEPTMHAQSAWADRDGDGDLDLFLMDNQPLFGNGFVKVFDNDQGTLTVAESLGIQVDHGMADWGDYDADGDMDIIVCGNIQEVGGTYSTVLRVYTNTGTGYDTTDVDFGFGGTWLDLLATTWADYDSDGDMDLLVTGNYVDHTISEIRGKSDIYINNQGTFTPMELNLPAPIDSIGRGGAFTWLDIDLDGDLDYLVAGAYYVEGGNGLVEAQIHLYRNNSLIVNLRPSAPSQLAAIPDGDSVSLSWLPAGDDGTPQGALTYELLLRRLNDPEPVASQHSPEPGNLSAVNSWQVHNLADGTYVWSLHAVDSAFNAGELAEGEFTIGTPPLSLAVTPKRVTTAFVGFQASVTNQSNQAQSCQLWVEMVNAQNQVVASLGPQPVPVEAGATAVRLMRQKIPAGLPRGVYTQRILIGTYPNQVIATQTYQWSKRW